MSRVVWFARGGGIARCGPFETQVEATQAMRLHRDHRRGLQEFPDDVFVWPEEVTKTKQPTKQRQKGRTK